MAGAAGNGRGHGGRSLPPMFASAPGDRPGEEETVMTEHGKDLWFLADAIDAWLAKAPDGPLRADSAAGAQKLAALEAANDSGFLSGEAKRPPPEALAAGVAAEVVGEDGATGYELTEWGRWGAGFVLASIHAEVRHVPGAPPPGRDHLAGLLGATLPLLRLPEGVEGIVEFTIDPDPDDTTSWIIGVEWRCR